MRVNLHHDRHSAPYARNVPLSEAFPDPDERSEMLRELELSGFVDYGGGAAAYVYVVAVKRRHWPNAEQ